MDSRIRLSGWREGLFEKPASLLERRGQSIPWPTLGLVVDGSAGGAGQYPHECGLHMEKILPVR